MAIRRGKRPDARFYTVSKDISEDDRLSWAARGMLIFLLGKPDNWTVSVAHLIKQTEGSQRSTGRDGVRAIIKELMDAGYMQADGVRTEGGTFGGMNYVVNESPETDLPSPVKPHKNFSPETPNPASVEPGAVEPTPVNPLQINTDHQQRLKEANTEHTNADESAAGEGGVSLPAVLPKSKQTKHDANIEALPEWIPADAWVAFVEMRKAMGAKGKLTERAAKLIVSELEKLARQGHNPRAVLEQSVINNWRGVFPLKNGNRQQALEARNRSAADEFVRGGN